MKNGKRIKKRYAIALGISLCGLCLATAGAVTYAGYVNSVAINRSVGSQGYRSTSVFLKADWSNGENDWKNDGAIFYIWAFNKKAADEAEAATTDARYGVFVRANVATNNLGYYVFEIPLASYTHVVYLRVRPDSTYLGTMSWSNASIDGGWKWNQTNDICLWSNGNYQNLNADYTINLYTLTGWGEGNTPGNASLYSPS